MAREIDEAWVEEAVDSYRRTEELRAYVDGAVQDVLVTVRSSDGSIEVLVSAAGEIRAVNLLAQAQGRTRADLSRSIRLAVVAAADAGRWAREKMYAETFRDYWSLRKP